MSRRSRLVSLLPGLLLGVMSLVGCHQSTDVHVFTSSIFEPMNIEIAEQVTQKRLWHYEIPVYHRLKLKFRNDQDKPPFQMSEFTATRMKWWLLKAKDKNRVVAEGEEQFTGVPIIMKMSLRPAPEYPEELKAARATEEAGDQPAESMSAPVESTQAPPTTEPMLVSLDADGSATVGRHHITDQQLTDLMKAMATEAPDRPVIIEVPSALAHDRVARVLDLCKQAGIQNVSIQSSPEAPPEASPESPPEDMQPAEEPQPESE